MANIRPETMKLLRRAMKALEKDLSEPEEPVQPVTQFDPKDSSASRAVVILLPPSEPGQTPPAERTDIIEVDPTQD